MKAIPAVILILLFLILAGWFLHPQPSPSPTPRPVEAPFVPIPTSPVQTIAKERGSHAGNSFHRLSSREAPSRIGETLSFDHLALQLQPAGPGQTWQTRASGLQMIHPFRLILFNGGSRENLLSTLDMEASTGEGAAAGLVRKTRGLTVPAGETRAIDLSVQLPASSPRGFLELEYRLPDGSARYQAVFLLDSTNETLVK